MPTVDGRRHLSRYGNGSGRTRAVRAMASMAIARGLIARPKLFMLDEPSLGLAPNLVQTLYSALADLRDEEMTILLVDQIAGLAPGVADRAFVLESGAISHGRLASEVRGQPGLEQAYLGEVDGSH